MAAVQEVTGVLGYVVEIKGVMGSKQNDGVSSGKFFRNKVGTGHCGVNGRRLNHVRISRTYIGSQAGQKLCDADSGDSLASPVFFL